MSTHGAKSDPFTAYANGEVSSPTVMVLGRNGRSRGVRYADLARACGGELLHLGPAESQVQLNPLDPAVILSTRSGKVNS